MKKAIKTIKYQLAFDVYSELFSYISEEKLAKLADIKQRYADIALQPVPLHITRERKRGFNQSDIITRFFSQRLGIPQIDQVKRTRATAPQASLYTKAERKQNIENAFEFTGARQQGRSIILVDDVFTSGSTTNEIARILKAHNVKCVFVFSLAHGSF
jgi:ComF family protein